MQTKKHAQRMGGAAGNGPSRVTAAQTGSEAPVIPLFQKTRDLRGRWPVPRASEILVVPVGGLGRIGMNWTLYGHAGRWILIDAGVAFPGEEQDGVDVLVPDPKALAPILPRLDALIVTHAHEDHIGAIDKLWPSDINCPIYATPFAAGVLDIRFEEAGTYDDIDLRHFSPGETFDVGPFRIRSVRMTHSVPEPVALAISTNAGTVVHSGDWKLDANPVIGQPVDLAALAAIGDAGVMALLCDSTNAHRELPLTSEMDVYRAFRRVFERTEGTVAVCCFGTNMARVSSAARAAEETGRQIAVAGRSMRNSAMVCEDLGYLDPDMFLAEPSHLKGLDRREVALVCTGTQGEENASLARLAAGGGRRLPALGEGDAVILSSRTIPGNEGAVEKLLSALRARGVEVITQATAIDGYPVHVTGHPGREELRTMYRAIRPRFAIPVHGTDEYLARHAELALECGAESATVSGEGEVLAVSETGVRVLGCLRLPMLALSRDDRKHRQTYRPTAIRA